MSELFRGEKPDLQGTGPIDKKTGRKLNLDAHNRADTDESRDSIHHTLGLGPQQAAPGNHTHSIGDGKWLSYVPIVGGGGSVGSTGTVLGHYCRIGDFCRFESRFIGGGTGISIATSSLFSLPPGLNSSTLSPFNNDIKCTLIDAGTGSPTSQTMLWQAWTSFNIAPGFVFGQDDMVLFSGSYRILL